MESKKLTIIYKKVVSCSYMRVIGGLKPWKRKNIPSLVSNLIKLISLVKLIAVHFLFHKLK